MFYYFDNAARYQSQLTALLEDWVYSSIIILHILFLLYVCVRQTQRGYQSSLQKLFLPGIYVHVCTYYIYIYIYMCQLVYTICIHEHKHTPFKHTHTYIQLLKCIHFSLFLCTLLKLFFKSCIYIQYCNHQINGWGLISNIIVHQMFFI